MNLQGDEPLINIDDIRNLNKKMIESSSKLGTLASKIHDKALLELSLIHISEPTRP